jgi:hypothetical protein
MSSAPVILMMMKHQEFHPDDAILRQSTPPPMMMHTTTHPVSPPTRQLRLKKRVTFKSTVTIQPITKVVTNEDERERLYYSKADMQLEKCAALHACKSAATKRVESTTTTCCGLCTTEECRGLELYICHNRLRKKLLAKKAFFIYQHNNLHKNKTKSAEEKVQCLAAVSAKLSYWSGQVALETARLDSLRVYNHKDYMIPISEAVVAIANTFPVVSKRSIRRVTHDSDDDDSGSPKSSKRKKIT